VPLGRAINPTTKTNWKEVSVEPDTIINTKLRYIKHSSWPMLHSLSTTNEVEWKNALRIKAVLAFIRVK